MISPSSIAVNAAVFTCSICGEVSSNICSYCTKDACSNHRCERCKRCSDCCECEYPLSAEEAAPEAVAPSPLDPVPALLEPEALEAEAPAAETQSYPHAFLTPEESSVFAEERAVSEPRPWGESNVFAEEDEPLDEPRE